MTDSQAKPLPMHNFIVTIPRTASNLLTQILNLQNQPSIVPHPRDGYCFLPAIACRYKLDSFVRALETWTNEERSQMQDAQNQGLAEWSRLMQKAEEQGKGTLIKEHINWTIAANVESDFLHRGQSPVYVKAINPTCIPDEILSKICPTFLIRHPALVFPSLVRTAIDNEGIDAVLSQCGENSMRLEATYKWHIVLYKFLVASSAYPRPSRRAGIKFPVIIDAADLGNLNLMQIYAETVGLDADRLRFEWEPVTLEQQKSLGKVEARMKDTLLSSHGIIRSKLQSEADVDFTSEKANWEKEFGQDLAQRIQVLVEAAMQDYLWLFERRLTV